MLRPGNAADLPEPSANGAELRLRTHLGCALDRARDRAEETAPTLALRSDLLLALDLLRLEAGPDACLALAVAISEGFSRRSGANAAWRACCAASGPVPDVSTVEAD